MVGLGRAALNTADNINDMSKRLGESTEYLSQMQYVAKMTGTDMGSLTKAIQMSQKAIGEAARGAGEGRVALAALGLDVRSLVMMKPGEAFEAIGDALAKLPDPASRVAVAMKLFGESGTAMIPVFENGSAGVKKLRDEADRLGLTLDKLSAEKAAAANDAMTTLNATFDRVWRNLATNVAPAITLIGNKLAESLGNEQKRRNAVAWFDSLDEAAKKAIVPNIVFGVGWDWDGKNTDRILQAYDKFARDLADRQAKLAAIGGNSVSTSKRMLMPWEPGYVAPNAGAAGGGGAAGAPGAAAGNQPTMMNYWWMSPVLQAAAVDVDAAIADVGTTVTETSNKIDEMGGGAGRTFGIMLNAAQALGDGISNAITAAVFRANNALDALKNAAESIFGMLVSYGINFALQSLLFGPAGSASAASGGATAGLPLPPIAPRIVAGPIPGRNPGPIQLTVHVQGMVNPADRMSVRRLTSAIYDDLQALAKTHGPKGALA